VIAGAASEGEPLVFHRGGVRWPRAPLTSTARAAPGTPPPPRRSP
jgi:hypothetical protein